MAIGNIFYAPPISGTVEFSCTPTGNAASVYEPNEANGDVMAYCWHIHDGGGGIGYNANGMRGAVWSNPNPPYDDHIIWFNFYANTYGGGNVPVGTIEKPHNIWGLAKKVGAHTWSVQDHVVLKFDNKQALMGLPAGHYSYENTEFHVAMRMIYGRYSFNEANACGEGYDARGGNDIDKDIYAPAHVDINVKTYCNIENATLAFPVSASLAKPVTASIDYHVDCSAGTDFDVAIGKGLHFDGANRRMQRQKQAEDNGDASFINYSIDVDHWSGCGWGTGLAVSPFQTIKGTVPAQPTPPDGIYKDSMVVTVTYRNIWPDASGGATTKCAH